MERIYRHECSSPLGTLRLFAREHILIGLYFEEHKPAPKISDGLQDAKPFKHVTLQLHEYFEGERNEFDVPIAFNGTDFQTGVWSRLRKIGLGETLSYGELAKQCDNPKAVRAVGAAVGRNPISIIVPCHRVVGADGSLTGFAGGVERKRWLLKREQTSLNAGSA